MRIDNESRNMFVYFTLYDFIFYCLMTILIMQTCNSDNKTTNKCIIITLIVLASVVTFFPFVHLYNFVVGMYTNNGPMNLNMDRYFPYHSVLENKDNFFVIKNEITDLMKKEQFKCFRYTHKGTLIEGSISDKKCWKWYVIKDHNGWNKNAVTKLPYLSNLLRGNDDITSASISILEPNTEILPHRGYYGGILRYHLGLIIPDVPDEQKPYNCVWRRKIYLA